MRTRERLFESAPALAEQSDTILMVKDIGLP